jgi:hypothetical protein
MERGRVALAVALPLCWADILRNSSQKSIHRRTPLLVQQAMRSNSRTRLNLIRLLPIGAFLALLLTMELLQQFDSAGHDFAVTIH